MSRLILADQHHILSSVHQYNIASKHFNHVNNVTWVTPFNSSETLYGQRHHQFSNTLWPVGIIHKKIAIYIVR